MGEVYECHITFRGEEVTLVEAAGLPGWSFSRIDGDPVLGKGVLCYLTANFDSEDKALLCMEIACGQAVNKGLHPIRAKVEHVIYDRRF